MNRHTSVLIVGAGPSGLTAALRLKQHGIDCTIIDTKSGPTTTSNAAGVQARTLELWQEMGIVDEALAICNKVYETDAYADDKKLFTVDFSHIDSKFNFIALIPQSETEHLLRQHLEKLAVNVLQDHTLINLIQDSEKVTATIQDKAGLSQTLTADYVIGADGFKSKVRDAVGIHFEKSDFDGHFMMMDAQVLEPDDAKTKINLFLNKNGLVATFPMKNFARIIIEFGHDPEYKDLRDPTFDTFKEITQQRCCLPIKYGTQTWQSVFYIHEGIVDHYRKDRAFLVGDAAHVHSPAGGQGMNLGIQDAFCLANLLAAVLSKEAHANTLDNYEKQRRPFAAEVVKMSGAMLRMANASNPTLIKMRNYIAPIMMKIFHIPEKMANKLSMIEQRNPPSDY